MIEQSGIRVKAETNKQLGAGKFQNKALNESRKDLLITSA